MNFIFRIGFYVVALLMLYTMYSDITGNESSAGTRRGATTLVYSGELRPFGSLQDSGAEAEYLLDNPKLMYDFIVNRMREKTTGAAAPIAPAPGILMSPNGEQPPGAIALPRSLFNNTATVEEEDSPAPDEDAQTVPGGRESSPEMKLMGIISGRRGNLALINNQIWEEGDRVAGGRIMRIKDTKVLMMDDDGRIFFLGM